MTELLSPLDTHCLSPLYVFDLFRYVRQASSYDGDFRSSVPSLFPKGFDPVDVCDVSVVSAIVTW